MGYPIHKQVKETTIDFHTLEYFLSKELDETPTQEELWDTMNDLVWAWYQSRQHDDSFINIRMAEA